MNIKRAADHHKVMAIISKPKPKRRKTTERKRLIKRLDDVTREIVLRRGSSCVTCGSSTRLQCGHLITRARYGTRWDLMNCHIQCAGCNLRHEYQPEIYTRWFLNTYGEQEYQNLCNRAESRGKFTIDELETILMELEAMNE